MNQLNIIFILYLCFAQAMHINQDASPALQETNQEAPMETAPLAQKTQVARCNN